MDDSLGHAALEHRQLVHERAFLGPAAEPSPYWPGTVILLGDDGPPRVENALRGTTLPAIAA